MRLAFAGTPEFARIALERLAGAGHDIALVLCQPDRPAGRGMKTEPAPVKAFAAAHAIPVAQPRGLRLDGRFADDAAAARKHLLATLPEAIVVAAYGLILPPWLLALPRLGCINIHASLLPRWRGAAPIQRAIEAGDAETGVTLMQMDAGMDTGDMLLKRSLPIDESVTAGELFGVLSKLGAEVLNDGLEKIDRLTPEKQDAALATAAPMLEKETGRVDFAAGARAVRDLVRGCDPWPAGHTFLEGELLKLFRPRVVSGAGAPGSKVSPGRSPQNERRRRRRTTCIIPFNTRVCSKGSARPSGERCLFSLARLGG